MKNAQRYLTIFFVLFSAISHAQIPLQKGFADLTAHVFTDGPLPLDGEWELYMSQLISPSDFRTMGSQPKDFADFPSAWNVSSGAQNFGFATYRLKLVVPSNQPLALQIPHCYSAYRLWANGQVISSNGIVGESREESKPQWLPRTVVLPATSDTLTLVLQVSNFSHAIGGIRESIYVGDQSEMLFRESISMTSTLTLVVSLAVLFLAFVFVFLLYKSESAILFALLSLAWSIREAFSNQYLAIHYFPDFPWEVAVKIEYIGLFSVMMISMLFVGSLFKDDVNAVFKYLFCFCNLVFIAIAAFFEAAIFTQFLPVYLSFAGALLLYIVYILVRAVVYDRQGAWLIVTCVFMGVVVFAYDLIAYRGLANFSPIFTTIGYIAMFTLMAVALLFQVGIFKRSSATNMLTYDDLYGRNK